VHAKLSKKLDSDVYHLCSNVEVRTKANSVDIEHLIVSKYGFFVIRTQPFKGTVEGQANHAMWMSKGMGKPKRFPNPLSHNSEAVSVLRSRYDFPPNAYHSLIVFNGKGKFSGNMPNNVRHQNDFIEYILSKDVELLEERDVLKVRDQVRKGRIPNTLKTYSQYLELSKSLAEKHGTRKTKIPAPKSKAMAPKVKGHARKKLKKSKRKKAQGKVAVKRRAKAKLFAKAAR